MSKPQAGAKPAKVTTWVPSRADVLQRAAERAAERFDAEMGDLTTFGARLKLLRLALGLSVERAAETCGLDDGSWSNWENGTTPRNMNDVVDQIVVALEANGQRCSATWLMWGVDKIAYFTQLGLWPVVVKDAG